MDEKFRDARYEKTELDEYVASVPLLRQRHCWLTTIQLQYAPHQRAPLQYAPQQYAPPQFAPPQFAPEAGPSVPPPYAPASTSLTVPSGVPTNGVNVSTVFETIRGPWECYGRCMMSILTHAPQVLGYLTRWPLNLRTTPYCRH